MEQKINTDKKKTTSEWVLTRTRIFFIKLHTQPILSTASVSEIAWQCLIMCVWNYFTKSGIVSAKNNNPKRDFAVMFT